MEIKKINYKKFIEDNFQVLDREEQRPVPFKLNVVQSKYMDSLGEEYPEMDGMREIILKARQQGFSSLILAIFTADFLLREHSVSICISHRRDATELLFKKVKFYIQSYLEKLAKTTSKSQDEEVIRKLYEQYYKQLFKSDNKGLIENATNGATFYIGTAGTKVGGRGGSARNIHFSEAAFYQDTEMVTAEEIIVATSQQVPQGRGMIFIESTANGEGNYYQKEWERSQPGGNGSTYHPRFFGWQEFYSKEWVEEKRRDFSDERMWRQEYPGTADEAFITSGSPYFNVEVLDVWMKEGRIPKEYGRVLPDGHFGA